MKIHNFSAGPCILPKSVFQKAAESLVNYNNTGLSIAEMSHRSKEFVAVMENAERLVKELMNLVLVRLLFLKTTVRLLLMKMEIIYGNHKLSLLKRKGKGFLLHH